MKSRQNKDGSITIDKVSDTNTKNIFIYSYNQATIKETQRMTEELGMYG